MGNNKKYLIGYFCGQEICNIDINNVIIIICKENIITIKYLDNITNNIIELDVNYIEFK